MGVELGYQAATGGQQEGSRRAMWLFLSIWDGPLAVWSMPYLPVTTAIRGRPFSKTAFWGPKIEVFGAQR